MRRMFFTFCRSADHSFAGVYSDNNPVGRKWFSHVYLYDKPEFII